MTRKDDLYVLRFAAVMRRLSPAQQRRFMWQVRWVLFTQWLQDIIK